MIVGRALLRGTFGKSATSGQVCKTLSAGIHNRGQIGNRDWVGFGISGSPSYVDYIGLPFPAIRFKENTNELLALREKEKGDWRKLTICEKKILYRASFRQTFSEMKAPTGEWKSIMGLTLLFVSFGFWFFIIVKIFGQNPLPDSFSEEARRSQLRKMLVNMHGHLTGVSSKWDYERDDWKK